MNHPLKTQLFLHCALKSLKDTRDHYLDLIEARAAAEIQLIEKIQINPDLPRHTRRKQQRNIKDAIEKTQKWKMSAIRKWDREVLQVSRYIEFIDGFVRALSDFEQPDLNRVTLLGQKVSAAVNRIINEQQSDEEE